MPCRPRLAARTPQHDILAVGASSQQPSIVSLPIMPLLTDTSEAINMNGANLKNGACEFRVWAPRAKQLTLRFIGSGDYTMEPEANGHFRYSAPAKAGDKYLYVVDRQKPVPDPVSRYLPEGVHGPTQIVDPDKFQWHDAGWRGLGLNDYVMYELHVGTFSQSGKFEGVIEKLEYLKHSLGVSVIELMPVAAFPGERNWGYDGVSPYAVQHSYGGPNGLKALVDAAHAVGLAVVLDVVYNHLGNEGNYLRMFAPYFTDRHHTPWGEAINYDGEGSEGVRRYFVENGLFWIREYHLDGLRLDAVQNIYDDSKPHILQEIRDSVQVLAGELGRQVCLIAETDENDAKLVRTVKRGGYGYDALWSDDFHHSIHAFLTGERSGYYQDFGDPRQIARALNEGFVFQGEHFKFWNRPRGAKPVDMPLPAHVICIQNHDQIGNRAFGERLTQLVSRGQHKLAASLLLLAPHTPMLFMGEEYDEANPFQFFTSYGDPELAKAVNKGRKQEFKDFGWNEIPDPQDPATFERSRLNWSLATGDNEMLRWYHALLELRRQFVLTGERTCHVWSENSNETLLMQVPKENPRLLVVADFQIQDERERTGWKLCLMADEDGCAVRVYESVVATQSF
jgi:maltooligosyltrehalose trehalohydrolase